MKINQKQMNLLKKKFQSLIARYQIGFKTLMKGSDVMISYLIVFIYCIINIIKQILTVEDYTWIFYPDWIKTKKTTINSTYNRDKKFFQ